MAKSKTSGIYFKVTDEERSLIEQRMALMGVHNMSAYIRKMCIDGYIVREGFTMSELVEKLAEQYGWSPSVPNLSDKLRRESLRYKEAVELADTLGYDLVWQKRR